jgi:hypothetical protein
VIRELDETLRVLNEPVKGLLGFCNHLIITFKSNKLNKIFDRRRPEKNLLCARSQIVSSERVCIENIYLPNKFFLPFMSYMTYITMKTYLVHQHFVINRNSSYGTMIWTSHILFIIINDISFL